MAIMTANMAFPSGLRRPSNIIAFLNWQRVKLGTEKDCRTSVPLPTERRSPLEKKIA
jgi:hypothetical protein